MLQELSLSLSEAREQPCALVTVTAGWAPKGVQRGRVQDMSHFCLLSSRCQKMISTLCVHII